MRIELSDSDRIRCTNNQHTGAAPQHATRNGHRHSSTGPAQRSANKMMDFQLGCGILASTSRTSFYCIVFLSLDIAKSSSALICTMSTPDDIDERLGIILFALFHWIVVFYIDHCGRLL